MPGFGTKKRHRVGKLRHRAWIQEKRTPTPPDPTEDERGQTIYSWENVFSERVPIGIQRLHGGELERARQLQAGATHRVEMRYLPGITHHQRFKLDGRALYIGEIDNLDEANRFLVLICEEQIL